MSLNNFIHNELYLINAGEEVHHFFDELYTVFDSQGHSGSSAGFVISGLRNNDIYSAELPGDSLLLPFQKVLHRYNESFVTKNLPLFATAINFNPLTPLTGEDSEWVDHGDGYYQNKRCSSVFKDNGQAYYLDGYLFVELSGGNLLSLGYTSYYSRKDIEFPFLPDGVTTHLFYLDRHRDIQIKDRATADTIKSVRQLRQWAGYLEDTLIDKGTFFIDKKDREVFKKVVRDFFTLFSHFDYSVKESIMRRNVYFGYDSEESSKPFETLTLPDNKNFNCPTHLARPLRRIIATLPNEITVKDGNFHTLRDAKLTLTFHDIVFPTKRFQGWQSYDENKVAFNLHWGFDENPDTVKVDKLGYELRLVDNDNYLYQMRRRFGISHPKNKDRGQPDNALNAFVS